MEEIRTMSIDIETFSSEDLVKSGVYRYAEAPDFRVLLFGYSMNEGPVQVEELAEGGTLPMPVLKALTDPSVEKNAFNASFERVCLSRLLRDMRWLKEGEYLSPAGWRCSMIRCAYLGLPLSLASAGSVLGLDKQKLTEGRDLIRFFCRPVSVTGRNLSATSMVVTPHRGDNSLSVEPAADEISATGGHQRHGPSSDPDKWRRFVEYNCRDVEAEMQIQERLRNYPVPESVWKEYELDQVINDRGIRVDLDFIGSAMDMDFISRSLLMTELAGKTQLENPNSVAQVRQWLTDHGNEVESLGKKQVAAMLQNVDARTREVLLLRQQLAKSSVKKYRAMGDSSCDDGRIRGMFQFYGASRSGRWAGRGVQMQNLPQNHLPDLDQARDMVMSEDYHGLKMLYDSVPDVLSELVRTAFVPEKGKKFIVADFSAIEARVIAWLAGEEWRMKVFAEGGDIYCASASQMFHVPVEKHGVNGHLRQKGKIAELALGYGGSVGALKAMGALETGVPEEELQGLVNAWRCANPDIVRLWWDVDRAVKTVIREKRKVRVGLLEFEYQSGMLFVHLPSGRDLSYVKPRLTRNACGSESVEYQGMNAAKKWDLIESYGPKFVENIVQGISRDLLAGAMMRLEEKGYRIVAHVHDEVIIEAEQEDSLEEVCSVMGECPPWASGLQLRADGYECEYYRKD